MHYITLYVLVIHNIRCLQLKNSEVFGSELALLAETLSLKKKAETLSLHKPLQFITFQVDHDMTL